MSRLQLLDTIVAPADFFDRQERIDGWDQNRIRTARLLVVGAGALGNEVLKNLALLGFTNMIVVDHDLISTSNLSRTVLFGPNDIGKRKAEVAAQRTKDLCLEPESSVYGFHGDVVWELGNGLFRAVDLVLGCVDNIEARLAINRQCSLAGTPWIDAGIFELAGRVSLFTPPASACYRCGLSKRQLRTSRQRYSCDDFKRQVVSDGRSPTVQVISSLVAALQVQEAAKLLLGMSGKSAVRYHYMGTCNQLTTVQPMRREDCPAHVSYPQTHCLAFDRQLSLGDFLRHVSAPERSGNGAILDLSSERSFVLQVRCRSCSHWIDLHRPRFAIYDSDTYCDDCRRSRTWFANPEVPTETEDLSGFDLTTTPNDVLSFSLAEIGVPLFPVLPVRASNGRYIYYELTKDEFPPMSTHNSGSPDLDKEDGDGRPNSVCATPNDG